MFLVLLLIIGIYENVIQEYKNKLVQILDENTLHETYECHRCISKTKWHLYESIMTISCPKNTLVIVLLFYSHLMIAQSQFDLQKHFGSLHLIKKIINLGRRVLVVDYHFIQLLVINA